MPQLRISDLGAIGLNTDVKPTLLPPNAINVAVNVIPRDGSLRSVGGEVKLFDIDIEPLYHIAYRDIGNNQWVVVSDGVSVYAYDMTGYVEDITPATPFSGSRITFTDLNGILVVNSASDGPWYWPGPVGSPGPGVPLVALPGWDMTNWRCEFMIAHRYGLFALNMTEDLSTTPAFYPHKVRWSNSAQEGAVPTSWDAADLSKDAGDDILGETPGPIVGAARVRDTLYIVKEDAVYQARRVDGQYIYAISRLQGTIGTSAPRGWCEAQGSLMIFTSTDLLGFDGQRQIPVSDKVVSEGVFKSILEEYWERSQVYYHQPSGDLYISAVTEGIHLSDAFVYNVRQNTWGHRKLNRAYGFDTAFVTFAAAGDPWDQVKSPDTWDAGDPSAWNKGVYDPSVPNILVYESNGLLQSDPSVAYWVSVIFPTKTTNYNDSPQYCRVRREGIPVDGADGNIMLKNVWPEMTALLEEGKTTPASVRFRFGMQDTLNGEVYWAKNRYGGDEFGFDPQMSAHIDPRVTGRFLCWELISEDLLQWTLSSLTFEWEDAGAW